LSRRRSLDHGPLVNENLITLEAAARAALAAHPSRALVFDHAGRRYVVKKLAAKPRKLLQTLFMRWLVKRLTGQPLPLRTLALAEAAGSMDFEANRLKTLAKAGVRVPRVALVTPEFFILEYCGTVVATLLEDWPAATWRRELAKLAGELGEFHRAGQWHGGAQIKNITLHDGLSYRIDFEENFGEFLPLSAAQTADLVLFLNSISLAGPITESESRQLLPQLLDGYFAANPDPEIKQVIRRARPVLKRLAAVAGRFQRWSKKGIRRVLILVDVLDGVK
jgi:tRNA A-37 threonylcarbamoyl transferase component Bud32